MLQRNLDETNEQLRNARVENFGLHKEVEGLKNDSKTAENSVTSRLKQESERSEKEISRLRKKVDTLEEDRHQSDLAQGRLAAIETEARLKQETINSLESRLAAQSEQFRQREQEIVRQVSSFKTEDEGRKVRHKISFLFVFLFFFSFFPHLKFPMLLLFFSLK